MTAGQAAIPEMDFPPSRSLPSLLSPDGWTWHPPSDRLRFWVGEDGDGTRWVVKCTGGFCAVRERAFSVIAQALGISCQSSTFLKVPRDWPPFRPEDASDVHQLAILFLDEHEPGQSCDNCPLKELNRQWRISPYDVEVLRASPVTRAIDMAHGHMLGMLCEMHEPPGHLFTGDHVFVQIDNELMFSRSAGANLWESPWVMDAGRIKPSGLDEAVRLCENVLSLPDEAFQEALRLPPGYRPRMIWSVRREIDAIRPRARTFLETAAGWTGKVPRF